ncbi:hypothetical protein [Natronomonas sp.]|uniref:hypothetical protein n=1 Tax=Natronomonas sp. TaxID=2184060 RepID=UPI002FC328B4
MNRRTLLRTIAVAGSTSLAGCETVLYGKEGNETVATANSELAEAAAILNKIDLTANEEANVSPGDFEGYSPSDVTQHTDVANEALTDDDSDTGHVLSVVSTVLEETAYQYQSIEHVFGNIAEYRQRYLDREFENAIRAGDRFATSLAEVTEHANIITENLVSLDDAGYNAPVEGFSVERWANEQGVILRMAEAMTPLGVGFVRHANGMRVQQNAIVAKRDRDYQTALQEAEEAKNSFETAEENFSASLDLGFSQHRVLIEQFSCLAGGFFRGAETSVDALEAYNDGDDNKGDNLWEQAISEIEQVNDDCLSGE